jgi:DnaJ-class molecular chaperone
MDPNCQKCKGTGIVYEANGASHTCFDCLQAGKLTNFHHKFEQEEVKSEVCQKCKGTGIVKEGNGSSHTCWDCLNSGKLDNHSRNVPDAGIKI